MIQKRWNNRVLRMTLVLAAMLLVCVLPASWASDFFDDFSDGIWHKYDGNPVITRTETWEARAICEPTVLYENGIFRMWYMGCATGDGTDAALGYATSPDGFNWTKDPNNPILRDPSESVIRTVVVKNNGVYTLFASNFQWNGADGRINTWTSTDGLHWGNKRAILFPDTWEGPFQNTGVIVDTDGTWRMIYTVDHPDIAFWYAYSTDGVNWTKNSSQPVLSGFYGGDPCLRKIGNKYYIWHSRVAGEGGHLRIYCAWSTDMVHWTELNNPQIGYTQPWERGIGRPEVHWDRHLTDAELFEHGGKVWMYYQGAQNPLGVAFFDGTYADLAAHLENPPLQKWEQTHYGMVENKQLKLSDDQTDTDPIRTKTVFSDQEGYVIECKAQCYYGTSYRAQIVTRYIDGNNFVRFYVSDNNTTYYQERTNGVFGTPVNIGVNNICDRNWHNWSVEVKGSNNSLSVDGRLIGQATSSATFCGKTNLKVGLSVFDTWAAFDDVRITRSSSLKGAAYREIFPNKMPPDNRPISTCGWQIHYGSNARQYPTNSTGPDANNWNACVAGANGEPTDLAPVNSSADMGTTPQEQTSALSSGYLFWNNGNPQTPTPSIVWTAEVASLNIPMTSLAQISWYEANSYSSTLQYLAVRVGGAWYLYSQGFTWASNSMELGAQQSVTDFSGVVWHPMMFVPGTQSGGGNLSADMSRQVPVGDGNLEAVGIYVPEIGAYAGNRFDTFEVWTDIGALAGHLDLQGYDLGRCSVAARIELIQNGVTVRAEDVVLGRDGGYTVANVKANTYDVAFQVAQFLRRKVMNVRVDALVTTICDVMLLNGDANGDNQVTSSDATAVMTNIDRQGDR